MKAFPLASRSDQVPAATGSSPIASNSSWFALLASNTAVSSADSFKAQYQMERASPISRHPLVTETSSNEVVRLVNDGGRKRLGSGRTIFPAHLRALLSQEAIRIQAI